MINKPINKEARDIYFFKIKYVSLLIQQDKIIFKYD